MRKSLSLLLAAIALGLLVIGPALTVTPRLHAQDTGTDDDRPSADISVVKSVSVDGGASWDDAEVPTGPVADIGDPVSFLIEVFNVGDFPLTEITITDTVFDASGCVIPAVLEVDATFDCELGPFAATEGQHRNVATVTATAEGELVSDADAAHYYGGSTAALSLEKSVSIGSGDGAWYSADSAPGLVVPQGFKVSFRFEVSNTGTEVLNGVTLTDSMYDVSGCAVPASLAPGESFECVIGPFEVEDGGDDDADAAAGDDDDDDDDDGDNTRQTFVNVATVSATPPGRPTITVTDEAYFSTEGGDDDKVIIIIEGPIKEIKGNIIVIYDIEIEVDSDDPILTVIRIGDIIRIEGEDDGSDGKIVIIAIIIVIIDIDIYIDNDGKTIYRDDGDCGNAPPPWAPAHGWRRKCQTIIIDSDRGKGKNKKHDDDD